MADQVDDDLQMALQMSMETSPPPPEPKRSKPRENAAVGCGSPMNSMEESPEDKGRRTQRELRAAAAEKRMMTAPKIVVPAAKKVVVLPVEVSVPVPMVKEQIGGGDGGSSSAESVDLKVEISVPVEIELSVDEANRLFSMVFGCTTSKQILGQWTNQGIRFSPDPETSIGLVQLEGGPCGVLAAIQAFVFCLCRLLCSHKANRSIIVCADCCSRAIKMTEKLPDYELFRREKMRMNMEALDKRVYAERPGFKSYARDIVYGSANRPNKQNNNTEDDAPSDPEFDPHELDETPDADDDENGDACKDKGANSSKNTGPTSCGKRTRSRTCDASTTKTTRRTRSRAEAEGEEAAQATQAPANISSPEGRNSDTIAAQSDAIVAAQGQAGSSSGGSGQITKEKGKRRPYMGHALQDYTRRNGKMKIEFTEGKPRPLNSLHATKLSSECGVAVRKKLPIPLHWKEFKTEELKHAIPSAIKGVAGKFDMDRNDGVAKDVGTKILQKSIRQHRYRLKRDYFNGFTIEQALANKPTKLSVENWTRLVYYFADEKHQELCEKNQKNREGVKHKQKTGSRCYVAHRNFLKEKYNNEEPGAIDFFKESHTQKKTGTMSADALEAYTKMDEMRRECQSEGAEPKSDVEIVQHVMKEKSTYLATLGYSATSKTSTDSSTSTARILELEARLEQQEKEARESNEKHEQELTSRFEAQQLEIEELKRKQDEELDTIKKSQKDQLEALEKRQHEMDALLGYILRKQGSEPSNK